MIDCVELDPFHQQRSQRFSLVAFFEPNGALFTSYLAMALSKAAATAKAQTFDAAPKGSFNDVLFCNSPRRRAERQDGRTT